jgi:hypothetical protein
MTRGAGAGTDRPSRSTWLWIGVAALIGLLLAAWEFCRSFYPMI